MEMSRQLYSAYEPDGSPSVAMPRAGNDNGSIPPSLGLKPAGRRVLPLIRQTS